MVMRFAAVVTSVLEREAHDALRGLAGDDLEGFDHAIDHLVLDPAVEALGVLSYDDEIDIGIARLGVAGQALDRPQAGVEVELLSERHIDAAPALCRLGSVGGL